MRPPGNNRSPAAWTRSIHEATIVSVSDARAKQVLKAEAPMASANRSQEGFAYAYKPEFAAKEGQQPGEKNVGPIAQNMAANPVASTVVKEAPNGLLQLDIAKLAKLNSAGVASLQDQVDALHEALARKLKRSA